MVCWWIRKCKQRERLASRAYKAEQHHAPNCLNDGCQVNICLGNLSSSDEQHFTFVHFRLWSSPCLYFWVHERQRNSPCAIESCLHCYVNLSAAASVIVVLFHLFVCKVVSMAFHIICRNFPKTKSRLYLRALITLVVFHFRCKIVIKESMY